MKGTWCVPGGRPHRTSTQLERSVEQPRHDQATGGGLRSILEKEMELLFRGGCHASGAQQAGP